MMKQILQRENNYNFFNDTKFKIPYKHEKSKSRIKHKNKSFQKSKIIIENSFNDINTNISLRKLSKIYSFSKRGSNKNNTLDKAQIKKGKSSICLKIPIITLLIK